MKKSYLIFVEIWIFLLSIITFIGISSILKFDTGFCSLLYIISSIMLIDDLFSKLKNIEINKILTNIKILSSLDYSKLDNITKIDFSEDGNFYVYTNYKASYKLEEKCIPKNQEMLILLDKTYDRI